MSAALIALAPWVAVLLMGIVLVSRNGRQP